MSLPYRWLPHIADARQRRIVMMHEPLEPGETWRVCDVEGPGVITRLWFGFSDRARGVVLRLYWDDEPTPSVDVPLLDFFGGGHPINTPQLCLIPEAGYQCCFPMPFVTRARLELVNVSGERSGDGRVFVQMDYDTYKPEEVRESPGMFHAQWNRENPTSDLGRKFRLAVAVGQGAYVGSTVQIRAAPSARAAWYEAAGELHFVDGQGRAQLIAGSTAGHFVGAGARVGCFNSPGAGMNVNGDTVYIHRLHPEAPIHFRCSLYSLLGCVKGDYTAVSYWYQHEPHRDATVPVDGPAVHPEAVLPPGARDLPPRAQDLIEWLHGDGRQKAVCRHNLLDLNEYLGGPANAWRDAEAVVWATFETPRSRTAQFYVSYDDHIRVIFNDRLVFERDRRDGFGVDPVAVMMPAGQNTVRLETTNRMNTSCWAWAVGFRVANSEGRTLEEVEFRKYPDVPEIGD